MGHLTKGLCVLWPEGLSKSPGLAHDLCPLFLVRAFYPPPCLVPQGNANNHSSWARTLRKTHVCAFMCTTMHSHLAHRCASLLPSCPHPRGAKAWFTHTCDTNAYQAPLPARAAAVLTSLCGKSAALKPSLNALCARSQTFFSVLGPSFPHLPILPRGTPGKEGGGAVGDVWLH